MLWLATTSMLYLCYIYAISMLSRGSGGMPPQIFFANLAYSVLNLARLKNDATLFK